MLITDFNLRSSLRKSVSEHATAMISGMALVMTVVLWLGPLRTLHAGNAEEQSVAQRQQNFPEQVYKSRKTGVGTGSQMQNEWPALRPFQEKASWPAPNLNEDNYRTWLKFIRPNEQELKWRKIRWHKSLSTAAAEARRLQRPILLWTMNGHPCGET